MPLYTLGAKHPTLAPDAWVAPSASLIGDVRLEAGASIWFGAVLRGDNEPITIGEGSNVQENAVLHVDPGAPLVLGSNVTVGHQAMLHGCTIGDNSLVGIQAVVLNHARIGRNCLVGAGALVTEGKTFAPKSLIVGAPAGAVKTLTDEQLAGLRMSAAVYVEKAKRYADALLPCGK